MNGAEVVKLPLTSSFSHDLAGGVKEAGLIYVYETNTTAEYRYLKKRVT